MLALRGLALLLVESSHALLEAKQRLVDLCSLGLPLLVVTHAVLSSLTTCQVHQQQFAALLDALLLNLDLGDCVASARCIVGLGGVGSSHLVSLLY